jgi:hypothetical protein
MRRRIMCGGKRAVALPYPAQTSRISANKQDSGEQDCFFRRRSSGLGDKPYSIPGESRFLRPFLSTARLSPRKQRNIIAQVGSSGTGVASALVTVEADDSAAVGSSGLAAGAARPRSWTAGPELWPALV